MKPHSSPLLLTFLSIAFFTSGIRAEDLTSDVKVIQQSGSPKLIRCVLNGHPRSLGIELSSQVALAYDTWHGGIFTIWKPTAPGKAFKLDGAVYTGRHGPQPTTNGQSIFNDDAKSGKKRYRSAGGNSSLRYLGHKIEKNGIVTLSFSLVNSSGKQIALIEDSSSATSDKLHRQLKVSSLAEGLKVIVDFPKGLTWTGVKGSSVTITDNGKTTYTAKLP